MRAIAIFLVSASFCLGQGAQQTFEVASVKPCNPDLPGGNKKGGGGSAVSSPGRLYLPCQTVAFLIRQTLVSLSKLQPDGRWNLVVEGGPAWINSDRYTIDARAGRSADQDTMRGPMLQALLEDRFQLKTHREAREIPMYALTVGKSGLKLLRPDDRSCTEAYARGAAKMDGTDLIPLGCVKLQRTREGVCTPEGLAQYPPPPGQKPVCGTTREVANRERGMVDMLGASMSEIAGSVSRGSGRPVIDQTGIGEKFDFHMEYAANGAELSDEPGAPTSIF